MAIKGRFPTARPSLDLNFAKTKRLDPRITFTRTSSGTYVGADGLIRTAGKDEARFDYSPTTGESLGLLVEEQRTNLVLQSATFQPSSGGNPASYTVDQVAPDGTTTASRQTATNPRTFTDYTGIANAQYTFSFYCKVTSGTQALGVYLKNAVSDIVIASAIFTATTSWQRVVITGTTNGATPGARIEITGPVVGVPAGTVFWGAQLEAGAFPTSYIPTTTAAATRNADVASITGTNFSSWFNPAGGSVFSESDRSTSISSASTIYSVNDGTSNNRFLNARHETSTNLTAISVTSGVVDGSAQTVGLSSTNSRNRIALAQYVNDLAVTSNGTAPVSDTSVAIPTVTQLQIGSVTNVSYYNGTIRRLCYWNQRLSNAILQDLTR